MTRPRAADSFLPMLNLAGKTALVTGGSRGIGRAVCGLFGRLGARVAVAYSRDEAAARETVAEIEAAGSTAVALGPTSRGRRGRAPRRPGRGALGPVDVLVANHGIWKRAPIETMTAAAVGRDGPGQPHLGSRPLLRSRTADAAPRLGHDGLVASTAGQRGEPFHSHYAATKGAVIALTRSLAPSSDPAGSGSTASPWLGDDGHEPRGPRHRRGRLRAQGHPARPPRTPEEIAGPVAFLASDLAAYMHGQVLSVNGGAVMVG